MKNLKKILSVALAALLVLTIFSACSFSPAGKLIGAWRDSTGITGYEFMKDGKCIVTFADVTVPIINVDLNGDVDGVYTTEKREDGNYYVTITYTIYSMSVTKDYMFTVDGSSLTLTDTESGAVTVYIAYEEPTETAPKDSAAS